MMNKNWCGRDKCPHCQGYDHGPDGSKDCPWLGGPIECDVCGSVVWDPDGKPHPEGIVHESCAEAGTLGL